MASWATYWATSCWICSKFYPSLVASVAVAAANCVAAGREALLALYNGSWSITLRMYFWSLLLAPAPCYCCYGILFSSWGYPFARSAPASAPGFWFSNPGIVVVHFKQFLFHLLLRLRSLLIQPISSSRIGHLELELLFSLRLLLIRCWKRFTL